MRMGFILNTGRALCLAALGMFPVSAAVAADSDGQESAQKAVLVTGASSGIGRRMTELLAAEGYFVYAGARSQKDLDAQVTNWTMRWRSQNRLRYDPETA